MARPTRGVTKDSIKVIAIVPNDQQLAGTPSTGLPVDCTCGQHGTVAAALADSLAAYKHSFGGTDTYGRERQAQGRGLER